MTDLVARLKQWADSSWTRDLYIGPPEPANALAADCAAAAAEVERLRLDGIHTCHDECPRIACVQRREIERLRRIEQLALIWSAYQDDESMRRQSRDRAYRVMADNAAENLYAALGPVTSPRNVQEEG